MGHRFNSATRCNGHATLATSRWAAHGFVRQLLVGTHEAPASDRIPPHRLPRVPRGVITNRKSTSQTQLKGVTRDEIERAWGWDNEEVANTDLLSSRPRPWFPTARVDRTWYNHLWAEGGRATDSDCGSMMFYTDHHHWLPFEADILERLISTLSGGWTTMYAHDGLAGILLYMGIDDSGLCPYPHRSDWSSPMHTSAELGCDPMHAIWISHINQVQQCQDYCYVYRWDGRSWACSAAAHRC